MPTDTLYEEDFVVWTERQAEALRAAAQQGSNLPIDFENLAEEIEDLGSEKLEKVESLLAGIVTHLVLLAASPAERPRAKWRIEVQEFRDQIARVLRRNPSIRSQLPDMLERERPGAVRAAKGRLLEYDELDAARPVLDLLRAAPLTIDEVMADHSFPERGTRTFIRASVPE